VTLSQFDSTRWTADMHAIYDGKSYVISSVDFGEHLVGLLGVIQNEPEETTWVRCENVALSKLDELNGRLTDLLAGGAR